MDNDNSNLQLSNIVKLLAFGIVAITVGYGLGYFYAPDKVIEKEKIVEKVVEKDKEINLKEKEVIEKYDPVTGKLVERIIRDKEKNTKSSEDKTTTDTEKTVEKIKSQKMWAVKGGAAKSLKNLNDVTYRVGGEVRLPIFSSWLGVEADIEKKDPKLGAYLRLEF